VELKPWESLNSPLYAIIESLKNLVEYRVILERNLADVPRFREIELLVLAPFQYYRSWRLDNEMDIAVLKTIIGKLSQEFQTRISLGALKIGKILFLEECKRIYEGQGLTGQVKMTISKTDSIMGLVRAEWRELAGENIGQ
jgi:hypothetical protein